MNKIFIAVMNMVAIIIASILIGSEFGRNIGIAVGLLAWALVTPINESVC